MPFASSAAAERSIRLFSTQLPGENTPIVFGVLNKVLAALDEEVWITNKEYTHLYTWRKDGAWVSCGGPSFSLRGGPPSGGAG